MAVKSAPSAAYPPFEVKSLHLTDDDLLELAQDNPELRIERTARGDLVIMPPAGGGSSHRNARLIQQLLNWSDENGTGEVFDSSGGFVLPDTAVRSPDAAWVRKEKLSELSEAQWEKFLPLCPDFVIELRSPTDSLKALQAKMEEYVSNGATLGWLLDPHEKRVHIYTEQEVKVLDSPEEVSGEPLLPGFRLDLRSIF